MSTERFYEDLKTFTDFSQSMDQSNYFALPDDWYVVVTDVKGSTAAIERGAYKDVNSVATASIVAINNAVKPLKIPFVFGGDGASACIPASMLEQVKPALVAARNLARREFGLDLRIGVVPHSHLMERSSVVNIAKFRPVPHFSQAMFSGGALSLAEQLIKEANSPYGVAETSQSDASIFEGFECRWDEIPTPHDENISLLIDPVSGVDDERHALMQELLRTIENIYLDESKYHPVRKEQMRLTPKFHLLRIEAKIRLAFHSGIRQFRYMLRLQILRLIGLFFMRFEVETSTTNWGEYKNVIIQNTDYRKYDDTLRMVISGTTSQRRSLHKALEQYQERGLINFGLHVSKAALVTCIVNNYDKDHLHLLDGSDGGYAMAAKMLKAQKKVRIP